MEKIIYSEVGEIANDKLMNLSLDQDRCFVLLAFVRTWNGTNIALVNISEREGYESIGEAVTKHLMANTESYVTAWADELGISATEAHHDATNLYYYRTLRKGCNFDNLEKAIFKADDYDEKLEILNQHSVNMWRTFSF